MSTSKPIRVTLDVIHQDQMKQINTDEKQLPKYKRDLKEYKKQFEELNNTKINNYDEYYNLLDRIKELENKIENIITKKNDYFLNVGDLLFEYYEQKKNPTLKRKSSKKRSKAKEKQQKNIFSYFHTFNANTDTPPAEIPTENIPFEDNNDKENENNGNKEEDEEDGDEEDGDEEDGDEEDGDEEEDADDLYLAFDKKEEEQYDNNIKKMGKGEIINRYLKKTLDDFDEPLEFDDDYNYCEECDNYMALIHGEGVLRCDKCGYEEETFYDSDKPSYKDPPREMSSFSYRREHHLNELDMISLYVIDSLSIHIILDMLGMLITGSYHLIISNIIING